MKITDITVFTYEAKYAHGQYVMSGNRASTGQPAIVVRISTDTGVVGWAETAPLGSTYLPSSFGTELAALKELGPLLVGLDPRSPAAITIVMDNAMLGGWAAKAVIDIACWDILGKAVKLPTSGLLGGVSDHKLSGFAVIPVSDAETAVKAATAELNLGYTKMQLKAGDDPIAAARRVNAIRTAVPDNVHLWIDANAGWSVDEALTFAKTLGPNLAVPLEQPCRSLTDSTEVGRRTGLPVILDESVVTLSDLVTARCLGGVTGLNIKPSRVGGFTKARLIRDAAVALDMTVNIDDPWGGALTTAQNIQFASSTGPRLRSVDLFAEWTHPHIVDVPRIQKDGTVTPSPLPGNGYSNVKQELLGEPLFSFN